MAIEKYTTTAFIIKHYPDGEDNVMIKLYTKDFGLIFAKSQSMKKSVKLRGHLLIGRIAKVTLVQGREYFRIAGAIEMNYDREITAYICNNINRFIHGQEENTILFNELESYLIYCMKNDYNIIIMRLLIILSILYKLGYFDFKESSISAEGFIDMNIEERLLFITINKDRIKQLIKNSVNNSML